MLHKTEISYSGGRVKSSPVVRLKAGEKALMRLAVIDDEDRVLHISCGQGALLQAMSQKHRCYFCGTTDDIEKMRCARSALPHADILYAQPDDIPWHDASFSVMMCSVPFYAMDDPGKMLNEMLRALKPGGQMLITLPWYPAPIRQVCNFFGNQGEMHSLPIFYSRHEAVATMEAMGLESVTWHTHEIGTAVVIGWKQG